MDNTQIPWTSEDVDALRNFLTSKTGERLVATLISMCPALIEDGTAEKILVRSGKKAGYEEVFTNLQFLQNPLPVIVNESTEYPSLDDDKKWKSEAAEPK